MNAVAILIELLIVLVVILVGLVIGLVGLVICLLPFVGLGLIPAFIAKKKGLNFFLFWLFGFACLPAAIIVACVLKPKSADATIEATAE